MFLKRRTQWGLGLSCLLILVYLSVQFIGCDEAPFEPEPVVEPGYKVYFHNEYDSERWYTYNPETDHLDSLILPTPIGWRTVISLTGDRLYLTRSVGEGLLVIDLETRELITELPWSAHYLDLSPDGKLLAVGHDGFSLVNTADLSVQFHADTAPLYRTTFSWDGSLLLGAYDRTFGWATVADPSAVTEEPVSVGSGVKPGGRVLTSALTDHWYLTTSPFFFVDWDLQADSALFVDTAFYNTSYYSHHATQDGKYVVYLAVSYSPEHFTQFRIYDTQLQTIVDTIDTKIYHETGDTTYLALTEMVITPDSKWLVGISFLDTGYFLVYNLEELRIERFVEIPDSLHLINIACQTGL